jgi:hypothetical protein
LIVWVGVSRMKSHLLSTHPTVFLAAASTALWIAAAVPTPARQTYDPRLSNIY